MCLYVEPVSRSEDFVQPCIVIVLSYVWPSPWKAYNHTGWLGVKHQVAVWPSVSEMEEIHIYIYMYLLHIYIYAIGGHRFLRMYLWRSLCTLYLLACQVTLTVGDSGLCWCGHMRDFERQITPLLLDSSDGMFHFLKSLWNKVLRFQGFTELENRTRGVPEKAKHYDSIIFVLREGRRRKNTQKPNFHRCIRWTLWLSDEWSLGRGSFSP